MQAFTDLVGAAAVPAHSFDIAELTKPTPDLDTAAVDHGFALDTDTGVTAAAGTAAYSGYGGTYVAGCFGWPGIEQNWPTAWCFIKEFYIDNAMHEQLMGPIDNNGEDLVTVIDEWVEANLDQWQPCVDRAMAGS